MRCGDEGQQGLTRRWRQAAPRAQPLTAAALLRREKKAGAVEGGQKAGSVAGGRSVSSEAKTARSNWSGTRSSSGGGKKKLSYFTYNKIVGEADGGQVPRHPSHCKTKTVQGWPKFLGPIF